MATARHKHELGPSFQRYSLAIDRGQLSYLHRPGNGPTIVLIPGSFDDSSGCKDMVDRLDTGIQVVIVELRGHGESWPPPHHASIESFSDDVFAVTAAAGLRKPYFAGGHSIGGMIALEMARANPDIVCGVISIEGWTHHRVISDAFEGRIFDTLTPDLIRRKDNVRQRVFDRWTQQQVAEFQTYWRRWDGSEILATTQIPILELYGDRNLPRPARDALGIPDRKNIDLVWLPGASHYLNLERPAEVAAVCNAFIFRVYEELRL